MKSYWLAAAPVTPSPGPRGPPLPPGPAARVSQVTRRDRDQPQRRPSHPPRPGAARVRVARRGLPVPPLAAARLIGNCHGPKSLAASFRYSPRLASLATAHHRSSRPESLSAARVATNSRLSLYSNSGSPRPQSFRGSKACRYSPRPEYHKSESLAATGRGAILVTHLGPKSLAVAEPGVRVAPGPPPTVTQRGRPLAIAAARRYKPLPDVTRRGPSHLPRPESAAVSPARRGPSHSSRRVKSLAAARVQVTRRGLPSLTAARLIRRGLTSLVTAAASLAAAP